ARSSAPGSQVAPVPDLAVSLLQRLAVATPGQRGDAGDDTHLAAGLPPVIKGQLGNGPANVLVRFGLDDELGGAPVGIHRPFPAGALAAETLVQPGFGLDAVEPVEQGTGAANLGQRVRAKDELLDAGRVDQEQVQWHGPIPSSAVRRRPPRTT